MQEYIDVPSYETGTRTTRRVEETFPKGNSTLERYDPNKNSTLEQIIAAGNLTKPERTKQRGGNFSQGDITDTLAMQAHLLYVRTHNAVASIIDAKEGADSTILWDGTTFEAPTIVIEELKYGLTRVSTASGYSFVWERRDGFAPSNNGFSLLKTVDGETVIAQADEEAVDDDDERFASYLAEANSTLLNYFVKLNVGKSVMEETEERLYERPPDKTLTEQFTVKAKPVFGLPVQKIWYASFIDGNGQRQREARESKQDAEHYAAMMHKVGSESGSDAKGAYPVRRVKRGGSVTAYGLNWAKLVAFGSWLVTSPWWIDDILRLVF